MSKTKKKPEIRSALTLAVFVLIVGGAFFLNLFMPKPEVLASERRMPAPFPKFSADAVISGGFMNAFGKYATDNFIFRDELRTIRAASVLGAFMQTDKSGLYYDAGVGAGKFEKLDEGAVRKTAGKIKKLCELLPGVDIYFAAVPDKSRYAARYFPGFDIARAVEILEEELPGVKFIDLAGAMTGEDFYRTDIHWDQSRLLRAGGILDAVGAAMGLGGRLNKNFTVNTAGTFYGVYAGQLALPLDKDVMTYLTSEVTDGALVSYFNPLTDSWEPGVMYDLPAVGGRDPYDLFLRGVQPLIIIENPAADTARQLYLFRDSFGSSLAPALVSAYRKITIIDMRYIDSRMLDYYIEDDEAAAAARFAGELLFGAGVTDPLQRGFANADADALFLYSAQILNNPDVIMVKQ